MGNPNIFKKVSRVNKPDSAAVDDKQWLLNAAAIRAARSCIRSVEHELGIRLTLSHPDFLVLLSQYCELTDSPVLQKSYAQLTQYFDRSDMSGVSNSNPKSTDNKVIKLPKELHKSARSPQDNEYVVYKGRKFKRWNDGLEFQGLYRGQPRYS